MHYVVAIEIDLRMCRNSNSVGLRCSEGVSRMPEGVSLSSSRVLRGGTLTGLGGPGGLGNGPRERGPAPRRLVTDRVRSSMCECGPAAHLFPCAFAGLSLVIVRYCLRQGSRVVRYCLFGNHFVPRLRLLVASTTTPSPPPASPATARGEARRRHAAAEELPPPPERSRVARHHAHAAQHETQAHLAV